MKKRNIIYETMIVPYHLRKVKSSIAPPEYDIKFFDSVCYPRRVREAIVKNGFFDDWWIGNNDSIGLYLDLMREAHKDFGVLDYIKGKKIGCPIVDAINKTSVDRKKVYSLNLLDLIRETYGTLRFSSIMQNEPPRFGKNWNSFLNTLNL